VIDLRVEVTPRWAFRLPARGARDGLLRVRGGVVHRLLHVGGEPVVVRAASVARGRVLFGARSASPEAAQEGIARMRFALGVDDDLAEFHARFRRDPLIGAAVRAMPWLRVRRRPEPFEALAWAVTEQLIEYVRAAAIQRRIVGAAGRRCAETGLRDAPDAATVSELAPARLAAWDLSPSRALVLRQVAREVAAGRIALRGDEQRIRRGWRRLRAIPGVGPWTVETLAVQGQGRLDQLPAGDLNYLKLVGRLTRHDPRSRATEEEVRELFAPYHPWASLAARYAQVTVPGWSSGAVRSSAAVPAAA
jgi:3-methyladenine DNA glycosylase/8-oxoguanine DNA glycosylase